jgi:hypothetical protein
VKSDPQGYLDSNRQQGGPPNPETIKHNIIERLPVSSTAVGTPDDLVPDALHGHILGLYDRRDIGQPVESAGLPTMELAPNLADVNRFHRATTLASGDRERLNMWNCTACVKAVDARLAGTEPNAVAGFIADAPGTRYASHVTDAVYESILEQEWGLSHPARRRRRR